MATLIPQMSISEFHKLKVPQLKRLKSCEIYADGEYLFTFVNAQTDYVRMHTEYTAQLGNAVGNERGGETLEQILEAVNA